MKGNKLYWNGSVYVSCSGNQYTEGKTIARTKDGWDINEVEEDDTHTFVVIRSFLDQYLLVKEDYDIPTDGEITIAVWMRKKFTDPEFCFALSEMLREIAAGSWTEVDELPWLTTKFEGEVEIGFNQCPIATSFVGYLWPMEGNWYLARSYYEGGWQSREISYYSIPQKYFDILQKHFDRD